MMPHYPIVTNSCQHEWTLKLGLPGKFLPGFFISFTLSDMKTLTMRELNRKTASVLDALECGEIFELRRKGKVVGYITQTPPPPQCKPDWKAHFDWLRKQDPKTDATILAEFEEERRRLRARELAMGNLK
jgi:antitoxin (DNA-binding transcriptional repressor) of toxin-antitoxin stability system